MPRNLYALLVGIDEYPKDRDRLQGCVNDIKAVEKYLHQYLASDNYQLQIKALFNKDATRDGIILGFREHLSQANSDDVVLFYYSGHGSQENNIPEALWRFEPDQKNETLYCYDSGLPNGRHLVDKELKKLISEVAANNPHICVILDCCHSGSGTKDPSLEVVERLAPADDRPRSIDSYLFTVEELASLQAPHILIAAAEDHDTAKEIKIDGEKRGIFSYSLLKVLERPGKLTYRELWQEAKSTVSRELAKLSRTQSPQLEVTPPDDGNQLFLDGAIAERASYFTVHHNRELGWVMDGGAVHSIQLPDGEETTTMALFGFHCNVNDLKDPAKSLGEAKVTKVFPLKSQLEVSNQSQLSKEEIYKAVVTSVPLPAQGVYIEGEAQGVQLAEQAIRFATTGARPSVYIRQVQNRAEVKVCLECRNHEYQIRVVGDDRPLIAPLQGYTSENAKRAIARLEHIARWLTIRDLTSPPVSQIQSDDIVMELLFEAANSTSTNELRWEYQYKEGKWQPPRCQLKLTNKSLRTLYCTVLVLSDRFAVANPFFEAGYVRLEPKQTAWAKNGKYFKFTVDSELQNLGITETKDILKLIVSTAEFDAQLSTQEELDVPRSSTKSSFKRSTLNRLMDRAQFRSIQVDEEETYDDWHIKQIVITSVLPSK